MAEEEHRNWAKKCSLLKRKCEDYEEMNDILLTRTKRVHRMIERAENEKCFLVKRLKQFEVLDEGACSRLSQGLDFVSIQDNEKALLATAMKIRAELDAELEHMRTSFWDNGTEYDSKRTLSISNIAHHNSHGYLHTSDGTMEPFSFRSPGTAPPQNSALHTPQQSPLASVIITPTNLVQATIPTGSSSPSTSKTKKGSRSAKLPPQALNTSDKQKGRGQSSSKKKKSDADPNAPKKPSNAFFWFCQERRASLQEQFREEGVSGQHDLTKALARLWSEINTEDKKHYYHKYAADKARYDREMEEYANSKLLTPTQDPDNV